MPQSEYDFEDERDMNLLNKIDAKVRKHAKVVEVLERRTRKVRREFLVRWNGVDGSLSWEIRWYSEQNNG